MTETAIRTVDNRDQAQLAAYLQDRVSALARRVSELEAEVAELKRAIADSPVPLIATYEKRHVLVSTDGPGSRSSRLPKVVSPPSCDVTPK